MVAAWIRADTGVGPAIASPSHACNGNCADLPAAAINNMMPIAVKVVVDVCGAASLMPANETVPIDANAIMIARERPKSPTRFITNAFLAAVA